MKYNIETLKGIAPGKLIGLELEKRSTSQRAILKFIEKNFKVVNHVSKYIHVFIWFIPFLLVAVLTLLLYTFLLSTCKSDCLIDIALLPYIILSLSSCVFISDAFVDWFVIKIEKLGISIKKGSENSVSLHSTSF